MAVLSPAVMLARRITRLSPRRHLPCPLLALALLLIPGLLVAFGPQAPDVVQARRIELVDSKGVARAALTADSDGVRLTLIEARGRPTASLRLDPDARLTLLDASGHEVASLGAPRVQHLAE